MKKMTKKEIVDGNKIIADFDGWKHSGKGGNLSNYYNKENQQSHSDDFEYHSSWDWLMPVCKKIASEDEVMQYKVGELISECKFEILIVFKTIVKHIKRKNDKEKNN